MVKFFAAFFIFFILYFVASYVRMSNSVSHLKSEIRDLQVTIDDLNDSHSKDLVNTCTETVDKTCRFADCAVMSIEEIQDNVCNTHNLEREE